METLEIIFLYVTVGFILISSYESQYFLVFCFSLGSQETPDISLINAYLS